MSSADSPRARFEAEIELAGISLSGTERERLFVMWQGFLPYREQLRSSQVDPVEEPSFIEKPCLPGGGA